MPAIIEGLKVLAYLKYDDVLPQLVLGSDSELPDDSVNRITEYFAERLRGQRRDDAIYSDPEFGLVEDYEIMPTGRREQLRLRLIVSSPCSGRVYVAEQAPNNSFGFLKDVWDNLSG